MTSYREKKAHFSGLLTVYGRNPVAEALALEHLNPVRLHLAENNKPGKELQAMIELAERRDCEILYHDRMALSRISKNRKQDQGVALDVASPLYQSCESYLQDLPGQSRLLALDNIHNPQNLGMILRSCAAGFLDGVILPEKGCADISPLSIKASAGAAFHCRVLRCKQLADTLKAFKQNGYTLTSLELGSSQNLFEIKPGSLQVFILGNEKEGVSPAVQQLANQRCYIPMQNGVESLNVAVSASLIAYHPALTGAYIS